MRSAYHPYIQALQELLEFKQLFFLAIDYFFSSSIDIYLKNYIFSIESVR